MKIKLNINEKFPGVMKIYKIFHEIFKIYFYL